MAKSFASSADLGEKVETLEVLADGVYALTAEGDPNVGAIEGEDFLVAFEARATPVAAADWRNWRRGMVALFAGLTESWLSTFFMGGLRGRLEFAVTERAGGTAMGRGPTPVTAFLLGTQ